MKHILLILSLLFSFYTVSQAEIIDQIDAVVNGELLLASEVDDQIALQISEDKFNSLTTDQRAQVRYQVLENLIRQTLMVQEVKHMLSQEQLDKIKKDVELMTNDQIKQFQTRFKSPDEMVRENERAGMTWDDIRKYRLKSNEREFIFRTIYPRLVATRVGQTTPDEIEKFKAENPGTEPTGKIRIAHILLRIPPNASPDEEKAIQKKLEEILIRARSGERFDQLATEFSEDQATAPNGGEVPPFSKGELSKEFDAAFDLNDGDISNPIRTDKGFHIMKVIEKDTFERLVFNRKMSQKAKEWFGEIRKKAKIDIKQKSKPDSVPAGLGIDDIQ